MCFVRVSWHPVGPGPWLIPYARHITLNGSTLALLQTGLTRLFVACGLRVGDSDTDFGIAGDRETNRHISKQRWTVQCPLSTVCQAANSLLTGTWSGITNAVSVLLSHNASSLDILFAIFSTQHATTRMNTNNEQQDVLIDSNSKQQLSAFSGSASCCRFYLFVYQ